MELLASLDVLLSWGSCLYLDKAVSPNKSSRVPLRQAWYSMWCSPAHRTWPGLAPACEQDCCLERLHVGPGLLRGANLCDAAAQLAALVQHLSLHQPRG